MDIKKQELRALIDSEHGKHYSRNVNLSGYTVYRRDSFISFRFVDVNNITTVVIDYIYVTSKTDLIKLLSFCINFFSGNNCKYIYLKEHRRQANYVQKYLSVLGFEVKTGRKKTPWKYDWVSTNGFAEDEILEAYI